MVSPRDTTTIISLRVMDNRETKEIDSMARIAEQVDLVTTMGPTG